MQVLSFQPPVPSATAYAYPTQDLVEVQAHGLWSLYIETWFETWFGVLQSWTYVSTPFGKIARLFRKDFEMLPVSDWD